VKEMYMYITIMKRRIAIMTRSCGYVRWNVDVRDLSLNQDFEGIGSLSHNDVEERQYWELILRRI
jgi:hypothetical protein